MNVSPRLGRLAFILFGTVVGACGGEKSQTETQSGSDLSPGEKCLGDASAPREPVKDAPESISVSHILIRHKELARPDGATISREQACLKALEALEALTSKGDWAEAVDTFSDSGKSTHGELGKIRREDVTPAFADAAFSLEVDELSYVVETDRGFHVILRTQ